MSMLILSAAGAVLPISVADGLLQSSDFTYLGAFKLPVGTYGASSFDYGVGAMVYNAANGSLFVRGHDQQSTGIGEITIPSLGTGAYAGLPTATVLQNFVELKNRVPDVPLVGPGVGGMLLVNGELIGGMTDFYDGSGTVMKSHFRLAGTDVATSTATGLYQLGTRGGGWVGGWMCPVPAEWQAALGTEYLTGSGCLSIISRTSRGPSAFGFDPADIGAVSPVPVVDLLYYDGEQLGPFEGQSYVFNASTNMGGILFPENTDTIIYSGRQGIGELYYGTGTDNIELHGTPVGDGSNYYYDPSDFSKGYHAWPYRPQLWAYDANDFAAVKAGSVLPNAVFPYAYWELPLPYSTESGRLGGMAWNPATRIAYIAQRRVSSDMPVIHAFGVT